MCGWVFVRVEMDGDVRSYVFLREPDKSAEKKKRSS